MVKQSKAFPDPLIRMKRTNKRIRYYIRKFNKKWQAIKFLLLSGILFRSYIIFIR